MMAMHDVDDDDDDEHDDDDNDDDVVDDDYDYHDEVMIKCK